MAQKEQKSQNQSQASTTSGVQAAEQIQGTPYVPPPGTPKLEVGEGPGLMGVSMPVPTPLEAVCKALVQAGEGKGMPVVTLAINAAMREVGREGAAQLVEQLERVRKAAERAHVIAYEIAGQL